MGRDGSGFATTSSPGIVNGQDFRAGQGAIVEADFVEHAGKFVFPIRLARSAEQECLRVVVLRVVDSVRGLHHAIDKQREVI